MRIIANRFISLLLIAALLCSLSVCAIAETGPESSAAPGPGTAAEPAPTEGTTPTEGTQPSEETTPTEETQPSEETAPTEETLPSEETAPTEETLPSEETAPTEETLPSEETAPTEETLPSEETAPTEETEPAEELAEVEEEGTTAPVDSSTTLADGTYTPEGFSYSGGTGKVTITCPSVTVSGGKATATIVISSSRYDYIKASGSTYATSPYSGGGVYAQIPVDLNVTNTIIGHTTAMTSGAEVTYSLCITLTEPPAPEETAPMEETEPSEETAPTEETEPAEETTPTEKPEEGTTAPVDSSTTLADGTYTPEGFSCSGGTGKVTITCPSVTVSDGKATAAIVISSSRYDYIKASGSTYATSPYSGGGVYAQIPVDLNVTNTIIGHTTAMTSGAEIAYTFCITLTEPPAPEETFSFTSTFQRTGDEITVTVTTPSTAYEKIALVSADGSQTEVPGAATAEGFVFTFPLSVDALGQTVQFVPMKADGTAYSQGALSIEIPADLEGDPEDEPLEDGKYETSIESDFSMFKITSQSATVKDGVITVTFATSKNTYDRIHLGTYADRDENGGYASFIQGVKKEGEDGYSFTLTLPKESMGTTVPFVPGKPNGDWYTGKNFTNQYYLTIPKITSDNKVLEDGKYETSIESDFSMFKITSQSATVKDGVITVTFATSKNTYDRIHLGTYADRDENGGYASFIQGVKKEGEDGYSFTLTLPKESMGTTVPFVPGKPNGDWYTGKNFTNQYYLTIPATLGEKLPEETEQPPEGPSYADGDYTADASSWVGLKLEATKISISGDRMLVTITTGQMIYNTIFLGSKDAIDESKAIPGVLANGNTAYNFTFELPVSALGTSVDLVLREAAGRWMPYQYSLKLPETITQAVPDQEVNINDYAPGEYTGDTKTYTITTVNGETAYNNNAAFSPVSTNVTVNGDDADTITVQFTCGSTEKVHNPYLYLGSKEDAANAADSDRIPAWTTPSSVAGGVIPHYTLTLPRSALGQMVTLSVFDEKNGVWYQYAMRISDKLTMTKPQEPGPDDPAKPGEDTPLDDGSYSANVETGAAMFKVVACTLNAKDGKYTAQITLSGTGYDKLYMGSAADAASSDQAQHIGYTVDGNGKYVFTIPVSALDTPIPIASHSLKNDKWYDRTVTILSSSLEKLQPSFANGDYTADVETGAAMFKVVACTVTAKDGSYTAQITLSGTGYDKLYMGSAADAASSGQAQHIGYTVDGNGKYVFTIPVSALDTPIPIASHSLKNDKWYDRTVTILSETMKLVEGSGDQEPEEPGTEPTDPTEPTAPEDTNQESSLDGTTSPVDSSTSLADGSYTPDKFSWSGGSGRVGITCGKVTVSGGKASITIGFSSPNYAYVKANGRKYFPSVSGGYSWFTIPVKLNSNNRILGMTTAMTLDHEVAYTIYAYIEGADQADKALTDLEKAAQIIGLTYESTDSLDYGKLFQIHRYDDGFAAIDVADAGRWILVPEGAEIPVGLDEDATLIQLPIDSVYVGSEGSVFAADLLKTEKARFTGFEAMALSNLPQEQLTYAGAWEELDFAALLRGSCDIAILPERFAAGEDDPRTQEELAALKEVTDRLDMLGIAAFVDRCADEETPEARLEWLRVYGLLFGQEEEALACYTQELTKLSAGK